MTFQDIMQIVQVFLIPLLAYCAWVLRDINNQLRALNGRIIRVESWKEGHEKLDDTRFEAISVILQHTNPKKEE